jgi:predicted nucleic acid-binding protein
VKWFLYHQEADRDRALALRALHISGKSKIFIPRLTLVEVLTAIRSNPNADEATGQAALEALEDLHLETIPGDADLLRKTNAIAWAYKMTIYDALYVGLAEQLGYPLITADERMIRQLKNHSILVPLREFKIKG